MLLLLFAFVAVVDGVLAAGAVDGVAVVTAAAAAVVVVTVVVCVVSCFVVALGILQSQYNWGGVIV